MQCPRRPAEGVGSLGWLWATRLGTEPRSAGRATRTLNHWAISSTLVPPFLILLLLLLQNCCCSWVCMLEMRWRALREALCLPLGTAKPWALSVCSCLPYLSTGDILVLGDRVDFDQNPTYRRSEGSEFLGVVLVRVLIAVSRHRDHGNFYKWNSSA